MGFPEGMSVPLLSGGEFYSIIAAVSCLDAPFRFYQTKLSMLLAVL